MRAPPGRREHDVAFGIVGMFRDEDPRNGFATHDVAESDRGRIGFPVIHPAAHVWVERQVLSFEQQLTGSRRRDRGFLQAEVGQLRPPLGAGGEDDLAGSHIDISRKGFLYTGCFRATLASSRLFIEVLRSLEHRVGVSRGLRDWLDHVPVLEDLAAFQAEDVHHRLSARIWFAN